MIFSQNFLKEIRARADVLDVVSKHVKLNRRGKDHVGLCPFHSEKTPSFTVNVEKNFYHCFGCGAHGDVIKFVQEIQGLSFRESVENIALSLNMKVKNLTNLEEKDIEHKEFLRKIIILAKDYYLEQFSKEIATTAYNYLKSRLITAEIAKKFEIGYAPKGGGLLKNHLLSKGIKIEDIFDSGLVKRSEDGRYYDFFRDRIMFPILDERSRAVAFGARAIGEVLPKYINSAESVLFHKGKFLYNFYNARSLVKDKNNLVIVEGYMDVISLSKIGFAAVAPLGTSLTIEQIKLAWKISKEPIICMDGDEGGKKAILRIFDTIFPHISAKNTLRFVVLPIGEDPDSLVNSNKGKEMLMNLFENPLSMSDAIWKFEFDRHACNTPESITLFQNRLMEKIKKIQNIELRKAYEIFFSNKISETFGYYSNYNKGVTKSNNIYKNSRFINKNIDSVISNRPTAKGNNTQVLRRERAIVETIINNPELLVRNDENFAMVPLITEDLDVLRLNLLRFYSQYGVFSSDDFIEHLKVKGFYKIIESQFISKGWGEARYIEKFAKKNSKIEEAEKGWRNAVLIQQKWFEKYSREHSENIDINFNDPPMLD